LAQSGIRAENLPKFKAEIGYTFLILKNENKTHTSERLTWYARGNFSSPS